MAIAGAEVSFARDELKKCVNSQHQAVIVKEFEELMLELKSTGKDVLNGEHKLVLTKAQQGRRSDRNLLYYLDTKNLITEAGLFDRNYVPIENTNPQKYSIRFDAFTDKVLPDIQEPILNRRVYSVCRRR